MRSGIVTNVTKLRASLWAMLLFAVFVGEWVGGSAIGSTAPWDASWDIKGGGCTTGMANPHDRGLLFLIALAFIAATLGLRFGRDRVAGALLGFVAAITGLGLALQSLSWQEYRLLNGVSGESCSGTWPSAEYLLRDADWWAAQQTQMLYYAALFGLILIAATSAKVPNGGRWRRSIRGKERFGVITGAWAFLMALAVLLAFSPLLSAQTGLEDAPQRDIPLYSVITTLLIVGLSALLPNGRPRAIGTATLTSAITLAFGQYVWISSFIESHIDRIVSKEGGATYELSSPSDLTDFQARALNRITDFYLTACIVGIVIFGLAGLARLLLGGTLFERAPVVTNEE